MAEASTIQDRLRGRAEAVLARLSTGPVTLHLYPSSTDQWDRNEKTEANRETVEVADAAVFGKDETGEDGATMRQRSITIAASALPRQPTRGDDVVIDGATYAVIETIPTPAGGDPLIYDIRTAL